ncbi:conjugative transposon protein TraM [Flavobacterium subsaxonicum]|uniref:Conjugal transfer protein TraM n=1 Tax=Flavobacterium subsaxonicum WB 4.1-42 = DSM 21790 TaxID=1121898 RepID=A0A0A2MM37_9FLAO|nr:conjugative transposon protein TraM [Flavobacterium subsaxonicum]KGO93677.1 conjugal transfer protein TraM [Flavobacterium subsaxonicum WB 4.1-42 = DSM 21790]
MEEKTKSAKLLRQRKMLLVLPLLVLPFITMAFWALGGGKMDTVNANVVKEGFNLTLPGSNLKEGTALDKMNYYERAALDSAKLEDLIKKDPNYLSKATKTDEEKPLQDTTSQRSNGGLKTSGYRNPNEERVYRKLEALQKAMNKPATSQRHNVASRYTKPASEDAEGDIAKLEAMMQSMNQPQGADPEMQQLNGMLENILDIQHPQRAQEKLRKASEAQRGQVFAVGTGTSEEIISSLNISNSSPALASGHSTRNGFYSIEEPVYADVLQNAVQAVIHETQTVVNGSTVKLRLASDIFIKGIKVPKDNFLFGTASLKGERLSITINSLRFNNSLFPVELSVYDMDGMEGIYIPGAISRDVGKASADRSVQTLGVATLDDSWSAQAAGAGIEAAKSLFSKKIKLIKVVVKSGYQVLLKDEKQKTTH